MQTVIALAIIILTIFGIADSGYVSYELFNQVIPPCGQGFDCGTVLTSKYAYIGPFSVANSGFVYYLTAFVVSILNFLDVDIKKIFSIQHSKTLKRLQTIDLLLLLTTIGFIFSLYLVFIMGVVIQSWCTYCLFSALTSVVLFSTVQYYHSKYSLHSSFLAKGLTLRIINWLYGVIAKPIFFLFDPELIHNRLISTGSFLGNFSVLKFKVRWLFQFKHPVLTKEIDGLQFSNPVGLSAGFDYNGDLTQILPDVGFGFHTIGTVTFGRYDGNPKPRLGRFPNSKALLVNKGLKSIGARAMIQKLSQLELTIPTGISIGSTNTHYDSDKDQLMDIIKCFRVFEASSLKHAYYELNISCPNTFGGESFTYPDRLEVLLTALDTLKISRSVYVKMPIDQSEKETLLLLKVADKHNVQGLIIGNLTKDRENPAVLPADKAVWKTKKGNVSGKPTFDRSNKIISLAKKNYGTRFTIIGTGGIFTAKDAQAKIDRGADLVQLITGMVFEGPSAIGLINLGLADKLLDKLSK